MARDWLRTGALAGLAGGTVYALVLVGVVRPLGSAMDAMGHHAGGGATGGHHAAGHAAQAADAGSLLGGAIAGGVSGLAITVAGALLWGLVLGVVTVGVGGGLLAPLLPDGARARATSLAGGGFLVVSGAPWLAVPPSPPGVEPVVDTAVRFQWYGVGVLAGLVAVALALLVADALRSSRPAVRWGAVAAVLAPLAGLAVVSPVGAGAGDLPTGLVAGYRGLVVLGQVALWTTVAVVTASVDPRWAVGAASAADLDGDVADPSQTAFDNS